jgi:hypothetical protein
MLLGGCLYALSRLVDQPDAGECRSLLANREGKSTEEITLWKSLQLLEKY